MNQWLICVVLVMIDAVAWTHYVGFWRGGVWWLAGLIGIYVIQS